MKRIIGGTLAALAIASGSVAMATPASATTVPQPAGEVQPFLWGLDSRHKTLRNCVDAGNWGLHASRWRAYDCVFVPDDLEWPWHLWVDYI